MRPVPIPDDYLEDFQTTHPGAYRKVLAAPNGRLDDDTIGALEVIWHPTQIGAIEGVAAATSLWMPDPNEALRIAAGLPLQVTLLTSLHPPLYLTVANAD